MDRLVAIISVGICPWADGPNSVEYIRTSTCDILILLIPSRCSLSGEQVGIAGLLSSLLHLGYYLLYNMLNEC